MSANQIQTTMKVGVINGAACDNYDRIGNVHLAMVPKGADTYVPGEVDRIEVARFITPFMHMLKHPMTVPYEWAEKHHQESYHRSAVSSVSCLYGQIDPGTELQTNTKKQPSTREELTNTLDRWGLDCSCHRHVASVPSARLFHY